MKKISVDVLQGAGNSAPRLPLDLQRNIFPPENPLTKTPTNCDPAGRYVVTVLENQKQHETISVRILHTIKV